VPRLIAALASPASDGAIDLTIVVRGKTNDRRRRKKLPHVSHAQILLTDMNAGSTAQPRDIGAIVDDEEGSRLAGALHEEVCQLQELAARAILLPELQQPRATGHIRVA